MLHSRTKASGKSYLARLFVLVSVSIAAGLTIETVVQGVTCNQACNNGVVCTYDYTESDGSGTQKGWLYENGCNRLLNSGTSDGTNTNGNSANRYKTATVSKICDKQMKNNLQGSANVNCGADPGVDWSDAQCGDTCVKK